MSRLGRIHEQMAVSDGLASAGEPTEYDRDFDALLTFARAVAEIHRPVRTHNPISNPDFYYDVCTTCVGPDDADHLWPCPTAQALNRLEDDRG